MMRRWLGWGLVLMVVCGGSLALAENAFDPDMWEWIDGSTALIPLSEALLVHLTDVKAEDAGRYVRHNTTSEAYAAITYEGYPATLIFVTPPSAEELSIASMAGVELELIPIARDALVVLNNQENPVTELTQEALRAIYQGRITNWEEVGGENKTILPYQRSMFSGSQTLFSQLIMAGEDAMEPLAETTLATMNFLIDAIADYENADTALGYSMFYYVDGMYGSDALRMLAIDGVVPNRETIASGEYPFCAYYYAVVRTDLPEDAPERALVDFILSDEGQRVVAGAGYVPLRVLEDGE